jgi:hypothetical protein
MPANYASRNVTPTPVQPTRVAEAPRRTGHIEVSVSEGTPEEAPAPSEPPPGERGLKLRVEADRLRRQGLTQAAAAKYRQAIGQLEAQIEQSGTGVEPYRAAIKSCQTGLAACGS